jgi:putative endonuclease
MRLKYCVYVLISLKDKKLYVGYTTNLTERLTAHFGGKVESTGPRRPFRLIYSEYHHAMSDAKRREKYLKTTAGKTALKKALGASVLFSKTSCLSGCQLEAYLALSHHLFLKGNRN